MSDDKQGACKPGFTPTDLIAKGRQDLLEEIGRLRAELLEVRKLRAEVMADRLLVQRRTVWVGEHAHVMDQIGAAIRYIQELERALDLLMGLRPGEGGDGS